MDNMLSKALKEIAGPLNQLLTNLAGENGQIWLEEFKKFLRKEPCWPVMNIIYSRIISGGEKLIIEPTDGSRGLADATDVFACIDADFKNYGADELGQPTAAMPVVVREMCKDANFAQMFDELNSDREKLCLTPHQIKIFVQNHRRWLRTDGYSTFFLFKSQSNFFVARVSFGFGGGLRVRVGQFGRSVVWGAEYRRRIVVPKLA